MKFFNSVLMIVSFLFVACETNEVDVYGDDAVSIESASGTEDATGGRPDQSVETNVTIDTSDTAKVVVYEDLDGDGYSSKIDCNDNNPSINPGAKDTCATLGVDDNCDGKTDEGLTETVYLDADKDGYGLASSATVICVGTLPAGYVLKGGDCNDSPDDKNSDGKVDGFWISPAATETCSDGVDNNCDGKADEGCAPESSLPKKGSSAAWLPEGATSAVLMAEFPGADVLTKFMAVEYFAKCDIGKDWNPQLNSMSKTNVVFAGGLIDLNACGLRLNVAVGDPALKWLCMNDPDPKIRKDAKIRLFLSGSNISVDVSPYLQLWPSPDGKGCSALLEFHDCK